MNETELLKKIPKEHYTIHNGKTLKVGELIKKLEKKNEKNTSNGTSRNGKNHSVVGVGKDS